MESLEEELTCPVCLELFACPLQLPCNHSLCHRCAEILLESETTVNSSQDGEEAAACSAEGAAGPEEAPDSFPCPTCRQEVSLDTRGLEGLRKNLLLQNIVDRYIKLKGNNTEEQIPCQLCQSAPPKMATKSCLTCKASYCEQCLTLTHPAFPPFSEHKLISPRTSFDEAPQTVMCPDHPSKPVEMYCVQDQTPVCLLCEKVGRHKQHNMAALEEVFSQRRAELQDGVDRLGARVAEEEEEVLGLESQREQMIARPQLTIARKHIVKHYFFLHRAKQLSTQIDKHCDSLLDVIQRRWADMHLKLQLLQEQDDQTIQEVIKHTTEGVQKARTALTYAQEVMKETDHASLLLTDQAVKAKIEGTIKTLDSNCEEVTCEIKKMNIDLGQWKESLENVDLTAPPDAPVIKDKQCSTTMETAVIAWDPDDETNVYDVRYSVGDVQTLSTVRGCSYAATGLTPGTKYKFEVSAKTTAGWSCPSIIELVTKPFAFRLDLNTASKYLLLSQDNTCVKKVSNLLALPDSSLRFVPDKNVLHTVLGDKPIRGGRHYWEVSVEGEYSLGVAYGDIPRNEDIRNSWALDYYKEGSLYTVMSNGECCSESSMSPPLSKIGVLVDYDAGQLSFFNASTATLIYTYTNKGGFWKPLYPAFSLWNGSMQIYSGLVCP
ncbi:E3 ubiquitin-protein ligase Midline-1-like [Branchiostoma floridae x Branchiostoma belcheri]